jgi:hypothetical protein
VGFEEQVLMRAERHFKPLPLEAATLLQEGRVPEAIKAVREAEHIGGRAARKRIDAHLAQEPLLRAQLQAQRQAARRRFFFWFLLVDALIVAALIWWFFYRDAI